MALRLETPTVVRFLNELVDIDRPAIQALLAFRTPCSYEMGDHPSVQVGRLHEMDGSPHGYVLGLLGVLNGYCGTVSSGPKEGWGPIMATWDGDDLVGFEILPAALDELGLGNNRHQVDHNVG